MNTDLTIAWTGVAAVVDSSKGFPSRLPGMLADKQQH